MCSKTISIWYPLIQDLSIGLLVQFHRPEEQNEACGRQERKPEEWAGRFLCTYSRFTKRPGKHTWVTEPWFRGGKEQVWAFNRPVRPLMWEKHLIFFSYLRSHSWGLWGPLLLWGVLCVGGQASVLYIQVNRYGKSTCLGVLWWIASGLWFSKVLPYRKEDFWTQARVFAHGKQEILLDYFSILWIIKEHRYKKPFPPFCIYLAFIIRVCSLFFWKLKFWPLGSNVTETNF